MDYNQLVKEYGEPGTNLVRLKLPYPMKLAWDLDVTITSFMCHEKIHDYLKAIFEDVKKVYSWTEIEDLGLNIFGGCYNNRPMRGGTKPSIHSWALAVDIDPIRNQLKWGRDKARLAKPDAKKFWEIVGKHCGVSLGQAKNYDWMHFQFVTID